MAWVLVGGLALVTVLVLARYINLKNALRQTTAQLEYMKEDILQNRRLYLSAPDKDLEAFSVAMNQLIDGFQDARIQSDRRERAFQEQIEGISHDLRTPLTVIVGYLSILHVQHQTHTLNGEALTEMLDILQRKAEGMERLVNQFYEYSRLIAQDATLTCEAVDFNKTVRETLLNNVLLLEQADIQVALDCDSAPMWIFADEAALERVITNLLQNVARYAKAHLILSFFENDDEIQLLMKNDTNILQEVDVARLFDRFYAGDRARSEGSSGLGLTIAKGLVEEMSGQLQAEVLKDLSDENERWICFTVALKKVPAFTPVDEK